MSTRLFRLLLLPTGLFLLTSCLAYRDIEVKDITIDHAGMQGSKVVLNFSATVRNPGRAFVLQQATGEVHNGQQPFAAAQLLQAITVAARSEQRYTGQVQLTVRDLLGLLRLGTDYTSWDLHAFLFTGHVQLRSAWIKKKFRYRDIPLDQLINNL